MWYLRDYPKSRTWGTQAQFAQGAAVIITGPKNRDGAWPLVADGYVKREYRLIWWPVQEYSNKGPRELVQLLRDPARRHLLWRMAMYHDYSHMDAVKWDPRQDFDMYVRDDVAPLGLAALGLGDTAGAGGGSTASSSSAPAAAGTGTRLEPQPRAIFTGPFEGLALAGPTDVAIAPDGARVIADAGNHRIVVLERDGTLRTVFGGKCDLAQTATSGCVDPDGSGPLELGDGQFNEPWGVAVGPSGQIFVSDTWNHRVERFDASGRFSGKWGRFGNSPVAGGTPVEEPVFYGPRGISDGFDGELVVSDTGNKRLLVFSSDGSLLRTIGSGGAGPDQWNEPVGIAPDQQRHTAGGRHLEPAREAARSPLRGDRELARPRLAQRGCLGQAIRHRRRQRHGLRRRSHRRAGVDLRAERPPRRHAGPARAGLGQAAATGHGGRRRRRRVPGGGPGRRTRPGVCPAEPEDRPGAVLSPPRSSFPTWARVVVGLLVAVAGLAIAFRRVDLAALGDALADASWSWFAGAMAAVVAAIVVRAWRWQLLLAPIERIETGPLFSATMIGYFGNGVLPMRLGELMRAVAIGRRGGRVDVSTALGSIAVERLLDVASALAVAALVVPFSGGLGGGVAAWSGAAALVIGAFGGLLWASRSAWVRRLVARVESSGGGKLRELAGSFLRGLLILGEGPKLVPIGLATVIIWILYAAAVWTAARAAGHPTLLARLRAGAARHHRRGVGAGGARLRRHLPRRGRAGGGRSTRPSRGAGAGVRDPVARLVLAADGRDRRALSAAQLDQAGRGLASRSGDRPPTLIGSWRVSRSRL